MLHKVILFRNGMVMAFDDIHAQVPELQGLAAEVRAKINQATAGLAGVGFYLGRWEIDEVSAGTRPVSRETFLELLELDDDARGKAFTAARL